jgi:hypothetical protein
LVSRKIWVVLSVLAAIAFGVIAYFYVTTSGSQPFPTAPMPTVSTPPQSPLTGQIPASASPQVVQDSQPGTVPIEPVPEIAGSRAPLQDPPNAPAAPMGTPPVPAAPTTRQQAMPIVSAPTVSAPVIIAPPSQPTSSVAIVTPSAPLPASPKPAAPKSEVLPPPPEPKAAPTPPAKKQSTQVIIPLPGRKADH